MLTCICPQQVCAQGISTVTPTRSSTWTVAFATWGTTPSTRQVTNSAAFTRLILKQLPFQPMEDDREPPARGKRPPQGEPVIDRALSLLSAFDAGQRRLSLAELSRRSGIPVSSTLRLAGHLVRWGALERDEEGRYCVGLRLLEVASLAPRGHGLRQVAMPFMSDLAEVTHQHVQLAVREGTEATLVERLSAHQATPVRYRIGAGSRCTAPRSASSCSPSRRPPCRRSSWPGRCTASPITC